MKANPTTPPDPSTMVLGIARFIESAARYSEHAAELAERRGRGELSLTFGYDPTTRRIRVDAVARDGRRVPVLVLTFRDRHGWISE